MSRPDASQVGGSIRQISPSTVRKAIEMLRPPTRNCPPRRNLTALPGVHSPEAAQPSQKWARYGPPETGSERVQKLEHVPVGAAVEDCPFFERFPAAPCAIPRGEPDVWPEA